MDFCRMTCQATAFVRLGPAAYLATPLGRFATIEEAEAAARTAVDGFASFARISSPDGMSRLLVRNEYRGEPIPPNAIQRVGMGREDAANDEADSVNN